MTDKKKRTPGELLDAIHRMSVEDEQRAILEMSDDEVSAELASLTDAEGKYADPKAIGERGAAFVVAELAHQKAVGSGASSPSACSFAPSPPSMPCRRRPPCRGRSLSNASIARSNGRRICAHPRSSRSRNENAERRATKSSARSSMRSNSSKPCTRRLMTAKRSTDGALAAAKGKARRASDAALAEKRPPGVVRPPADGAVRAARDVLSALPFRRPRDIDLRLVASSRSIVPRIETLHRGEGRPRPRTRTRHRDDRPARRR